MKGIYITQDLRHAEGINEKIYKQIDLLNLEGLNVELRDNPKRTIWTLVHNLIPFFSKQYFNTDIDWQSQDFVYIRKGAVLDRSVLKLVKKRNRRLRNSQGLRYQTKQRKMLKQVMKQCSLNLQ